MASFVRAPRSLLLAALALAACSEPPARPSFEPSGETPPEDTIQLDAGVRPSFAAPLCSPCSSDLDCNGGGSGANRCVKDQVYELGACGTPCTSDLDCPVSHLCYAVMGASGAITGSACFPSAGASCFSAAPASCADTWSGWAQRFFQDNCVRCHTNFRSESNLAQVAARVRATIDDGSMPNDATLAPDVKARALAWIDCELTTFETAGSTPSTTRGPLPAWPTGPAQSAADAGFGSTPDAGPTPPPHDAGTAPSTPDAGSRPDASTPRDAGTPDTGVPASVLCQSCTSDTECNPNGTVDNFCVSDPAGGAVCGTACTSAADCPSGYDCYQLVDSRGGVVGANCFPANDESCTTVTPPTPTPDAGVPDAGSGGCTDTWSSYARSFFSTNCNRCHSEYTSLSGVSADLSRVRADIVSGAMPPRSSLSSTSISRIVGWIDCGAH